MRCRSFRAKSLLDSVPYRRWCCRLRWSAICCWQADGRCGLFTSGCMTGSVSRLPLAGAAPCAGGGGDVLPADGAWAIRLALRGGYQAEQAARTLGAGRWRVFSDYHLTAYPAGHYCRYGAGVCPFAWRIWRDHYLCFQYSGRNPHHTFRHVYLIQTPRRESAAARLCVISIVLALISLLISECWRGLAVNGRGANHAGA